MYRPAIASSIVFSVRRRHFWHAKIAVTCRRAFRNTHNRTSIAVGSLWALFAPRSSSSRAARYRHLQMSPGEAPLLVDVVADDPLLCKLLEAGGGLEICGVVRPVPGVSRLPCSLSDQPLGPEPNPRYDWCRTWLVFLPLLLLLLVLKSTDIAQDGASPPSGLERSVEEVWSKPSKSPRTNPYCQYKQTTKTLICVYVYGDSRTVKSAIPVEKGVIHHPISYNIFSTFPKRIRRHFEHGLKETI